MNDNFRELKQEFSEIFHQGGLDSMTRASAVGLVDFKSNIQNFKSHPPAYNQSLTKIDGAFLKQPIKVEYQDKCNDEDGGHESEIHVACTSLMNDVNFLRAIETNQSNTAFPNYSRQPSIKDESEFFDQCIEYDRLRGFDDFQSVGLHSPNPFYEDRFFFDEYNDSSLGQMWGVKVEESRHSFGFEKSKVKVEEESMSERFSKPTKTNFKNINRINNMLGSPEVEPELRDFDAMPIASPMKTIREPKGGFSQETNAGEDSEQEERTIKREFSEKKKLLIKKEAMEVESDGWDLDGEQSSKRGSNGLRVISRRVLEILSEKQETTFIEVAEILAQDMKSRARFIKKESLAKEEKNLKRRVYDALNVLIASNVIEKRKKCVLLKEKQNGITNLTRCHEKTSQLKEQIKQAKEKKKAKIEYLQELITKNLAVRSLTERNKRREARASQSSSQKEAQTGNSNKKATSSSKEGRGLEGNIIVKAESEAKILNYTKKHYFPFLVLSVASDSDANTNTSIKESDVQLSSSDGGRELLITSERCFQILGDIDILLKMNLQKVNRDSFVKYLSKELLKYAPKNYFK